MRIVDTELAVLREKMVRPFGFKGGYFTELRIPEVTLRSRKGTKAKSLGVQAVLWSDARIAAAHSEADGNRLMTAILEFGLQRASSADFETPIDLLETIFPDVYARAVEITGLPDLRKTFVYNALVALDNAAWVLYARENGRENFDEILPRQYRKGLKQRHAKVGCIPLFAYNTPIEEVRGAVDKGHFLLKIKIGAPGDPATMLDADMRRIEEIHAAVGSAETPHTVDGRVRYYLDANGRYPDSIHVRRLLGLAEEIGMLDRISIFEEPFDVDNEEDVSDLPVPVAADESLDDPEDVSRRIELGYSLLALKPAAKTLSLTLGMIDAAEWAGVSVFVADLTCPPRLVQWNKNVAARLEPLPGFHMGLMESNGAYNYAGWDRLLSAHPCSGASWLTPTAGVFELDESFYETSGGIFMEE